MYACMYVYMSVCTELHRIYVFTCMYACMHLRVCECVCACVCVNL